MSRFYVVDNPAAAEAGALARFGPFPAGSGAPHQVNTYAYFGRSSTIGTYQANGPCRMLKFPGVLTAEAPARGSFTCAAKAGIVNESTFELDDSQGFIEFALQTVAGPPPVADVVVDLTSGGIVTGANVATAIAAAINAYTGGLSDDKGGWLAVARGASVRLVQQSVPDMTDDNRSVLGHTYGAFGNVDIDFDVGTGFTNVKGMKGGRQRLPGVAPVFVLMGGRKRVIFSPIFLGPVKA